jgi:endo-1,4-beta-xylanase
MFVQRWNRTLLTGAFLGAVGLLMNARAGEASGTPTLRELAQQRGFRIGAAVAMPLLDNAEYRQTLSREFNLCVAENAFKMESLRPARDRFDFQQVDRLCAFAQTNRMKLRGHTLVWHQQMPWWLSQGHWTRDEALGIMKDHITTVMQHCQGKVYAWDVVNEAISDQGPDHPIRPDSFWTRVVGTDYVEKAFEFARAADPQAILYYNDYSNEGMDSKSEAVFQLVKRLKAKGLVDAVGWQCHLASGWKAGAAQARNAERLAKLGLDISITELDFRITLPVTPKKLQMQAESYRSAMRFCLSQPNIKALVMWGFTDKSSCVPYFFKGAGAALIFDEQYQPKPAYEALREELTKAK